MSENKSALIYPDFTLWTDGGNRDNVHGVERYDAYGSYLIQGDSLPGPENNGIIGRVEFGPQSNNEAEYLALINGLAHLLRITGAYSERYTVLAYTDSKLMANQINGRWKIKAAHLRPYAEKAKRLARKFAGVRLIQVDREQIVARLGH